MKLTAEQIDALPDGAEVVVTWSGGNGPHRYTVARRHGMVLAVFKGIGVAPLGPEHDVQLAEEQRQAVER